MFSVGHNFLPLVNLEQTLQPHSEQSTFFPCINIGFSTSRVKVTENIIKGKVNLHGQTTPMDLEEISKR